MIATVTINPAIDVRYNLSTLQMDKVNRVSSIDKTAGGKGLNVSRVLTQLGAEVTCTGFLGGKSGEWIAEQLPELKLMNRFVSIKGDTRSCLAILSNEGHTEILEHGPKILENEKDSFLEMYDSILETANYVVVSGSLPDGIESDFYQTLAEKAGQKGRYLLLDSSGTALSLGIQGKPFLIKPNKEEFCKLIGKNHLSMDDVMRYAQAICRDGVEYVLLSLGKEGAILASKNRVLQAVIPAVKEINQVGSGDSMLAGFTYAHSQGLAIDEVLKWACSCGMSNAASEKTGYINLSQVHHYVELVKVIEINMGG
ncbi:1-phosphofructokinase [Neobacillus drentensis]|uniref:1-phosphofructokinase n=1 Tax=Neobacillus drentensis TaxID=220684 RepID=UPI002FFF8244